LRFDKWAIVSKYEEGYRQLFFACWPAYFAFSLAYLLIGCAAVAMGQYLVSIAFCALWLTAGIVGVAARRRRLQFKGRQGT